MLGSHESTWQGKRPWSTTLQKTVLNVLISRNCVLTTLLPYNYFRPPAASAKASWDIILTHARFKSYLYKW